MPVLPVRGVWGKMAPMGSFGGEGRLIAGRYRLESRLGRGGMGTVWRATDELLARQVAVKELHLEAAETRAQEQVRFERTMREARTVAQVKHPNVIVVHDVVEQDERPWIVMELVDGTSLADRLTTGGPLAPREAARIGVALFGALRVAHARGVLHRDIKPANVLMEEGTGRVVLTDFGIAWVPGATTLTEAGGFVGSPEYTAPERVAGDRTGPESDLWSVGVLLCAVLSGRSPFHRDSLVGVLHAVVHDELELPEAVRPLDGVVRGLLERDPDRRLGIAEAEHLLRGYLYSGYAPEPVVGHTLARDRPPVAPLAPAATARPVGVPIPDALADRALAAAARPPTARTVRIRAGVLAALAVIVLAGSGAGIAVLAMDGGDGGDGKGGAGSGSPYTPTTRSTDTAPTATTEPTAPTAPTSQGTGRWTDEPPDGPAPSVPVTSKVPSGYRSVHDPEGFTMAVPKGFVRSYEKSRVSFSSPDKRFRIGVRVQRPKPGGPLGAVRGADANGPADYPGYRAGETTATTHNGLNAALWEFDWGGGSQGGGPRHTYDLMWNEGGRMFDVRITGPKGEQARAKRHFDTALDTFAAAPRGQGQRNRDGAQR